MSVRSRVLVVGALAALVGAPSGARALERVPSLAPADPEDAFRSGQTCTISYYNLCTGWAWIWYDWEPGDRLGVAFQGCGEQVVTSRMWVEQAPLAGYGFTGWVRLFLADVNDCPVGAPLQTQAFVAVSGWNSHDWSVVASSRFAIEVEFGPAPDNPTWLMSDRPAIGGGTFGCGNCYPATRVTHSFVWSSGGVRLCPGSPFFDGFCNAELLMQADMRYATAVEPSTWAGIKSLYR